MNKKNYIIAAMATMLICESATATVLTFDISNLSNGELIAQSYGDSVTSTTEGAFSYGAAGGFTQNVEVSYASAGGADLSYWSTGYTDLSQVIYSEADGESGYSITFTADAGFNVELSSLNLGNFGSAVTLPGLTITDGVGSTLFSQTNFNLPAFNVFPALAFTFNNVVANQLILHVDTTGLGGNSDNVGLDNIQFSQISSVPIPAAAWLFGSGLIGLVSLARRKQA